MRVTVSQRTGRPVAGAVRSWAEYNALPPGQRTIGVNVVGILPGADSALRTQAILVDAHYDHLGIGQPVNGDSIFNGADDDGSGTVAVLEIARVLAAQGGNKRTLIFAATTGEEVGLVGTNWYIRYPSFPLAQTIANLEIEMIGRPDSLAGGAGKGWLTGFERSTMGPLLAAAGIPIVADPRPAQNFFQRSDNIAFARLGMVAHTLSSFNLHGDYHTVTDDVSRVDFNHMASVIDAAVRATWVLANGPATAWQPGGKPAAGTTRPVAPPGPPR
jgi:Zn-dependent M28 family amino/carboxypeptidase